jgi:CrcB protein
MDKIILIAIGGAIGSVIRYGSSLGVQLFFNRPFPFGTLFVNVTGSFLAGLLFVLLLEKSAVFAGELRALLLIGFLGGFTTFSSFSIETLNLLENGELFLALSNILLSVLFCLVAAWLGVLLGRSL